MNISFDESETTEGDSEPSSFGWSLQEADDDLETLLIDRFRSMSPQQKQYYLDYAEIVLKMGHLQLTRKQKVDLLKAIEESARKPTAEDLVELVHDVVRRKKY